ncbi:MAG: hypothetical protein WBF33_31115 [Candidatus Nitrosopolaris sp.]|jgi:hypothetical protein
MLEQAKQNSNVYHIFIANLDAFVTEARSVTYIMQSEFNSINGFKEWYIIKQEEMKNDSDFDFFNNLRVDTTHVRPFNAVSKYTTSFPEGMTISAGKTVDVPLGKMDDRGNLVIDNKSPVSINGKPATNIKRSTTRKYLFTDRPNEDVVTLCETYFQKLQELVTECHDKFEFS